MQVGLRAEQPRRTSRGGWGGGLTSGGNARFGFAAASACFPHAFCGVRPEAEQANTGLVANAAIDSRIRNQPAGQQQSPSLPTATETRRRPGAIVVHRARDLSVFG